MITVPQYTILVIDDIPDNVKLLQKFLTQVGFKVLIAQEGQEGIKTAKLAHPDLILLDVIMPNMDGFEVCQYLKSQADTRDIPIIFLTAQADNLGDKIKGLTSGAADYITKPLQLEEVLARVNIHLNLHQLQQQLFKQNQQLQKEIAERQQSEQALNESHERFITVLESLEVAIYVIDIQTNEILFINNNVKQLVNEKELLGKVCWQVFDCKSANSCTVCSRNQLTTTIEPTTDIYCWEFQNRQTKHWFYIQSRAIRWIDGRWVRLEVATDITGRKQIEEALRASEERFELAMRGANDGLWDWNMEKNEVYYSPRWKQILGYTEHELSFRPEEFFQRIHPDDVYQTQEKVTAYLEKKIPSYEATIRLQHKNGHYVWVLSRGIAIWNEQDKPLRMVGTHVDLTEQKQAEETLNQAKEVAEVANRAKTAFLANMSHELRTPLNAILGYAQLFQLDTALNAQQQDGIAVIRRSGEYLLTLINDILELSKIEANRLELFPTEFYFQDFLKEINELFRIRTEQKGVAFHYQPLPPLPIAVHADEKRLRQILINLLSNAVKFTEQGEVKFKVSVIQQPMSKTQIQRIRFQVEDTGIGIAPEEMPKIFLPFQQAGKLNYQAQGTGLGLAISKTLVEMMGGQFQVESSLGQGSRFWLELDLPEISKEKSTTPDKQVIIGIEGSVPKILVVDDQLENRKVLFHLLSSLGFEVLEACNGRECVEKALQIRPDAILMDLVMPEMDGFEAISKIKEIPILQNVVIIAISASVFGGQQQSQKAGCNGFIAKPFQKDVLLDTLNKHLDFKPLYQNQTTEKRNFQAQTNVSTKGPSPEQAAILFDFTLKGDIEGIIDYVEQLEQSEPELQHFAGKVKQLAEDFQINQIGEMIKPYQNATLSSIVPLKNPSMTPNVLPFSKVSVINLSTKQASILFDLAMRGDAYGLRDYVMQLEQIEQSQKELAPFLEKIRLLATQFQYDKICELVQPYMD